MSEIIEIKCKSTNEDTPILVNFENGWLKAHEKSNLAVSIRETDNKTRVEVSTNDDQVFVGDVEVTKTGVQNFIVLHDKKNNKVRLVQVDYARLHNKLFDVINKEKEKEDEDYKQRNLILNKTFGGKKTVRQLEQSEKLNIKISAVEESLLNVVADVDTTTPVPTSEHFKSILPPCHRDATSVEQVYVLHELITAEELQSIHELAEKIISDSSYLKSHIPNFSPFFCSTLNSLSKKSLDFVSALLFAEALIIFLSYKAKELHRKFTSGFAFSNILTNKIKHEFCMNAGSTITRPNSMRDKTMCYIVALGLICCNYELDVQTLSKSTGIGVNKIIQLAKAVGVQAKGTKCILKLPLPVLSTTPQKFRRR